MSGITDEDGVWGEAAMTASCSVQAIKWVVDSVADNIQLLRELSPIIFPVVLLTLTPNFLDTMDEAIHCAIMIIYGTKEVNDQWMGLFPHMLKIVVGNPQESEGGYAFEYFSQMIGFFANVMHFAPDKLLTMKVKDHTYYQLFIGSLNRILEIADTMMSTVDKTMGFKMYSMCLHNMHGKVDNMLPQLITLCVKFLFANPPVKAKSLLAMVA